MNTSALKSFAPAVRTQLMEAVTRKLDFALSAQTPDYLTTYAPQVTALRRLAQADRAGLVERVAYTWFNRFAALRFMDAHGWHPFRARVLTPASAEETQPELLKLTRAGALPAELADHTDPKRLNDLLDGHIPSPDAQGEVYRHLVLATCRFYHRLLPNLFEKLDDETELLLPDDLLTEHSVVHGFRSEISDEDCSEVELLGWLYQFYISERKDTVMARKSAVPTEDIPAVTQLFTPHWIVRYLVENSLGRLWLLNRPGSRLREHMPYYIEGENTAPGGSPAETDFLKITKPEEIRLLDPAVGSGHMLTYAFDLLTLIYEEEGYAPTEIPALILRHNLYGLEICPRAAQLAELALVFKARYASRRFFQPEHIVRPNIIELKEVRFDGDELVNYIDAIELDAFFEKQTRAWIVEGNLFARRQYFDASKPAADLVRLLEEKGGLAASLESLSLETKLRATLLKHFKAGKKLVDLPSSERRHLTTATFEAFVASGEILDFSGELDLGDLAKQVFSHLFHQFEEAKNFGSLIQPCVSETDIRALLATIQNSTSIIHNSDLLVAATHIKVLRVLEQAEALTQRYQVVVANPPYMGGNTMNSALREFTKDVFPDASSDLFAMFMRRQVEFVPTLGLVGIISMQSWMFISSFEKFRRKLLQQQTFVNLLHLGARAFDSISGEIVQACTFVAIRKADVNYRTRYFDLRSGDGELGKDLLLRSKIIDSDDPEGFTASVAELTKIPGSPIAYWATPKFRETFRFPTTVGEIADPKVGMTSSDNIRFLRLWHEVSQAHIGFGFDSADKAMRSQRTWFPYNKGGTFRRWFGNNNYLIHWLNDGEKIKHALVNNPRDPRTTHWSRRIFNTESFFLPSLTWSFVSSQCLGVRYCGPGFLFDVGGSSAFPPPSESLLMLGLLNSELANTYLKIFNPTLNFQPGNIGAIPVDTERLNSVRTSIGCAVEEAVTLARADWDNFETSWDFRDQPLLRPGLKGATLEASWLNWEAQSTAAIRRMQELETENNRLFIAAYGLDGELQPEVPEVQITLARADVEKDMAAFLSYAAGVMFGRYSLDVPGLVLADTGSTLDDYWRIVRTKYELGSMNDEGKSAAAADPDFIIHNSSFIPDQDGILPVLDGEWFEDDIVARTRDFLRATFGEATLRENLRFIEDSLGKDLRKYFLTDFYKDHLQTYKKRPIYWMVQSPKKGFSVLLYLHRYTKDTINLVLNSYLRDYQVKLRNRITHLTEVQATATTAKAQTDARKEADQLSKTLRECEEWERQTVLPLAQARIELDLDDGVKVNYLKLGEALAPIPGLAKKDAE